MSADVIEQLANGIKILTSDSADLEDKVGQNNSSHLGMDRSQKHDKHGFGVLQSVIAD